MRDGQRDNDGGVYRENKRDREKYGEGKRMMLFALIVFNFVRVNSNGTTWLNFLFYFGEMIISPLRLMRQACIKEPSRYQAVCGIYGTRKVQSFGYKSQVYFKRVIYARKYTRTRRNCEHNVKIMIAH